MRCQVLIAAEPYQCSITGCDTVSPFLVEARRVHGIHWWCHHSLLRLSCLTRYMQCHRRLDGSSGAICGIAVWLPGISQSGTQTAVHPEKLSYRWTSSSTNTAHKEGCLPSWSLLGTDDGYSPWAPNDTGGWEVNWTTLPEAAQACCELLKCGGAACKGRCKCAKASLQCTALCHCGGLCSHN